MTHIKDTNILIQENKENMDASMASKFNESFDPQALSFEDIESSDQVQIALIQALDITLSWQVKRKSIEHLADNSIRTLKTNYKKAKIALKLKFAEAVAPGQCSLLAEILSEDEDAYLDKTIQGVSKKIPSFENILQRNSNW